MSARLVTQVLRSGLEPALRFAAVVMAHHAHDDGSKVFPSVDRVAQLLGVHRRNAQRHLAALRALGVLVAVASSKHHTRTEYRFVAAALPPADASRGGAGATSRDDTSATPQDDASATPPDPTAVSFQQVEADFSTVSTGVDMAPAPRGGGASATRSIQRVISTSTTSRAREDADEAERLAMLERLRQTVGAAAPSRLRRSWGGRVESA